MWAPNFQCVKRKTTNTEKLLVNRAGDTALYVGPRGAPSLSERSTFPSRVVTQPQSGHGVHILSEQPRTELRRRECWPTFSWGVTWHQVGSVRWGALPAKAPTRTQLTRPKRQRRVGSDAEPGPARAPHSPHPWEDADPWGASSATAPLANQKRNCSAYSAPIPRPAPGCTARATPTAEENKTGVWRQLPVGKQK